MITQTTKDKYIILCWAEVNKKKKLSWNCRQTVKHLCIHHSQLSPLLLKDTRVYETPQKNILCLIIILSQRKASSQRRAFREEHHSSPLGVSCLMSLLNNSRLAHCNSRRRIKPTLFNALPAVSSCCQPTKLIVHHEVTVNGKRLLNTRKLPILKKVNTWNKFKHKRQRSYQFDHKYFFSFLSFSFFKHTINILTAGFTSLF